MLSNMRFGFSISCFMRVENLATVAPSRMRWSAEILKLIASAGRKTYLPSCHLANVCALPIAMIAT